MNVTSQTTNREDVPSCFGTSNWDGRASECAGGADPKYTNPKNGSHVRDACDFFHQCGIRSQAFRMGTQLVPASQLRRPPMTPIPLPPAPVVQSRSEPTFREYMQQRTQQQPSPMAVPTYYPPQPYQHQPQYPYHPQQPVHPGQYPASTYQLNYHVPGYLSVPEVRTYQGSFWGTLFREVARALGKAAGHTAAAYFDSQPFRIPPPPPGGGQQQ
jgi:hypothetical protein